MWLKLRRRTAAWHLNVTAGTVLSGSYMYVPETIQVLHSFIFNRSIKLLAE